MDERMFHDELDHLVRDSFMPDDKKATAIAKLVNHYFLPKSKEGMPECIRCSELERLLREMHGALTAYAMAICELNGVEPTIDEYPIRRLFDFRDALVSLNVTDISVNPKELSMAGVSYEA